MNSIHLSASDDKTYELKILRQQGSNLPSYSLTDCPRHPDGYAAIWRNLQKIWRNYGAAYQSWTGSNRLTICRAIRHTHAAVNCNNWVLNNENLASKISRALSSQGKNILDKPHSLSRSFRTNIFHTTYLILPFLFLGALGRSQTSNLKFRKLSLFSFKLRGHCRWGGSDAQLIG